MSIGNLILGVNIVTVSYLIQHDSSLQVVTDFITKCDSYFVTKCDKFITKGVTFFITKCVSFITKCGIYYKLGRFYYTMRQLLQNVTFIINCNNTNTIRIYVATHTFIAIFSDETSSSATLLIFHMVHQSISFFEHLFFFFFRLLYLSTRFLSFECCTVEPSV